MSGKIGLISQAGGNLTLAAEPTLTTPKEIIIPTNLLKLLPTAMGSFVGSTGSNNTMINCTVVRTSVGDYNVTFDIPMSFDDYIPGVTIEHTSTRKNCNVYNKQLTGFSIKVDTAGADYDPSVVNFTVHGGK